MSIFRRSFKKSKPVINADSLGDLSEAMGGDYGHGFSETAEDPNVKPKAPAPPTVKDVGLTNVTLTWPPLGQAINKIVLQAMPAKKNPKASFKKFDGSVKGGGQSMTLTENANKATEATIVGLTAGGTYYFRLVVTNPKATVEGEITEDATKLEPVAQSKTAMGLAKAIAKSKVATMNSNSVGSGNNSNSNGSPAPSPKGSPKVSMHREMSGDEDDKAKRDEEKKKKEEEKKREEEEKKREKEEKKKEEERKKEEEKARKEEEKAAKKDRKESKTSTEGEEANFGFKEDGASSPGAQKKSLEAAAPKSIMNRLAAKTTVVITEESEFEKQEKMRSQATKMFADEKKKEVSKIYQALNPEKLFYESRREKEEASEEKWKVSIRGGGAGMARENARDYSFARNEEGEILQEEEEGEVEEEEDYDPKNVPDFGEFQEVMDKMRAERAEALRQRQERLREEYKRKKDAEEAARQEELRKIKEFEDARKAKEEITDEDVKATQARLEQETMVYFQAFSFKA